MIRKLPVLDPAQSQPTSSLPSSSGKGLIIIGMLLFVGVCATGLVLKLGPWQFWVGGALVATAGLATQNLAAAVGILIVIAPYNLAVRWAAGESLWVRGLRDFICYLIFGAFLIYYERAVQWRTHAKMALFFIVWFAIVQCANYGGLTIAGLGFRQLSGFFLLLPVVAALCSQKDARNSDLLLTTIVVTAGVLSVIQLAYYFNYIDLPLEGKTALKRPVGDIEMVRMIPIMEGSPSGLALYMMSGAMIVIARIVELGRVPLVWIACLLGCLACAVLTVSHSAVVSCLLGLGVLAFCGKKKWPWIAFAALLFLSLPVLFEGGAITGRSTEQYAGTFERMWWADLAKAVRHPIFGTGAAPTGYLSELVDKEEHSVGDGGWGLLAKEVGIPIAAVMFAWTLSIVSVALRKLRGPTEPSLTATRWQLMAALSGALVYFVNVHGVPWSRVGPDVNFIVLCGILLGLSQPVGVLHPGTIKRLYRSVTPGIRGWLPQRVRAEAYAAHQRRVDGSYRRQIGRFKSPALPMYNREKTLLGSGNK